MTIELADLKAHLNVTFDDDDDLLTAKIATAEEHVEAMLGHGFDTYADGLPAPLKEAVMQYAGHLYENRESVLVGVTAVDLPGFHEMIASYRDWTFG